MKKLLLLPLSLFVLAACSDGSLYSGDVYTVGDAKQVKNVSYGRLIAVRPVTVKDKSDAEVGSAAGAVLGGVLGSAVGSGSGKRISVAGGAILGGLAGNKAGAAIGASSAVELEIERDSGGVIAVVQTQGPTPFQVGQRVRMVGSGNRINVSPL
ncbi:glycine zipper 2TM domain-containing protein [Ignatzschineria sp. RMDPL8A]|uniref:glycine zipper 2TM domain-containing protein n=1 Tax=Ignatzschineria sp. RMDPL8A TaxID=2999236 RepID=UPI0016BC757C|nr:glycine zipper 2TM domain-containing protein [Ignatzschineria sp. RMDPL8A]MDG9730275.1 glycine zipper 2TM domain-containing protein [Ignatzschineria sp. RMDPL8A]NLD08483.1 glycine zipper 2TM domain-containing protein [Xanthomonadaceae bacterium]